MDILYSKPDSWVTVYDSIKSYWNEFELIVIGSDQGEIIFIKRSGSIIKENP